jgi:hypothetical protein
MIARVLKVYIYGWVNLEHAVERVYARAQVPPLLLLAAGALGGMAAAKYLGRR